MRPEDVWKSLILLHSLYDLSSKRSRISNLPCLHFFTVQYSTAEADVDDWNAGAPVSFDENPNEKLKLKTYFFVLRSERNPLHL